MGIGDVGGQATSSSEDSVCEHISEPKHKRQLVDAAVRLFIDTGYHETTTRDIAQAAGLTVGALYEYVKSKSDILYLVCESVHAEVEQLLRADAVDNDSIDVALPRALGTYFRACDDRQDAILLIYRETACLSSAARALVIENEERVTKYFDALLRRGVLEGHFELPSEKVTRLMAHNITILGQMWAFRRWYVQKQFSLEEYIAIQTALVMRDLKPR